MAAGSGDTAEIAQVQRITPVCPPRAYCGAIAAGAREEGAENAKANAVRLTTETQRTQRSM